MRYVEKWPQYKVWWDQMKSLPGRQKEFDRFARLAFTHKDIYQEIQARTSVPWPLIALTHQRESSMNFTTYLGNGQRLDRVTTIVPKGRGPFKGPDAFVNGAIDALRIEGLSSVKDLNIIEKILYYCEVFNGGGYSRLGLPSPYLFGGTTVQRAGKFTRDHFFDPHVWDTQPGCAPMLRALQEFDPEIKFLRES